jgi:hypothetical protein
MLTDDQILKILRSAFQPFDCGAEIRDRDEVVRFRLFGAHGKSLISPETSNLSTVRDPENLENWIIGVRQDLEDMYYELEPWNFPES